MKGFINSAKLFINSTQLVMEKVVISFSGMCAYASNNNEKR